MRITIVIGLSVFLMSLIPSKLLSQEKNKPNEDAVLSEVSGAFFVDHNLDQQVVFGMKLTNAIKLMEEQYGIVFIYDVSLLKDKTVKYREALPENILDASKDIVKGYSLRAVRLNEHSYAILPVAKPKPIVLPQRVTDIKVETIRGHVTDAGSGETLPGVNIALKGTNLGTATSSDGNYSLEVPSLKDTLLFSYIGYQTQVVPINGRHTINIALKSVTVNENQIIVVGYGQQKRRDVTSSIASVSADQIANEPAQQVGQTLEGKVAGVQIDQNTGNPSSGFMMHIRGVASVNDRSTQPLYVVDGNPMADPNDISPSDISNIQILKSASATAIYGARGANGVVLITTKHGYSGAKMRVNLNMYNGVQYAKRAPLVDAQQYAMLYNEALTNGGDAPAISNVSSLGKGTDWQNVIYRPGQTRNINLSISGGNKKTTYYVSGQYEKNLGVVRTTFFKRLNLQFNSEHKVASFFKVGENLNISRENYYSIDAYSTTGLFDRGVARDPAVPIKNTDGSWADVPHGGNLAAQFARQENADNGTSRPVLTGSGYMILNPLKQLTFKSQYNFVYGSTTTSTFNPAYFISTTDQNAVSNLTKAETQWKDWNLENTLHYKIAFGKNNMDAMVGMTAQENNDQSFSAYGENLPPSSSLYGGLRYLDLAESGQNVTGSGGKWAMLSYLGRINYNYNDRYLATINYRIDGSSKFGQNNRYGYFPSFSLGWRLSQEKFMRKFNFINNLMLRGGWGEIGNQESLPDYAFASSVTRGLNYNYNGNWMPGQAPEGSGNPDLKWESVKETDIGLSFTGFKNSVDFKFDYYYKITTDMLLQIPVVAYSGIQRPAYQNGGEVLNKGFEVSLGYQRTTPGNFYYSISANVSHNSNELTKLTATTSEILGGWVSFIGSNYLTRATVGEPLGYFYGYKMDGLFQTQADINNHATQPNAVPGDIRFKDLNGDGVIDSKDQTYLGSPWPKFTYGINANFSYKNFDLRLGFTGEYGNKIFAAWKWTWEGGNWFNYDRAALGRWHGPGTSNSMPRLDINDPNNNLRISDWYIEDGSYVKLKNIQIGYTFPQKLVHLRRLRVYVTGTNLLTITKYTGQDPEIGTITNNIPYNAPLYVGIDAGNYAVPRTITLGVNIGI